MLLCKVLCGRQERLKNGGAKGSTQFEPSSNEFDTGVDDTDFPRRILMWGSTLSTHILPVYAVSLRMLNEDSGDARNMEDGVDESFDGGSGSGNVDVGDSGCAGNDQDDWALLYD